MEAVFLDGFQWNFHGFLEIEVGAELPLSFASAADVRINGCRFSRTLHSHLFETPWGVPDEAGSVLWKFETGL